MNLTYGSQGDTVKKLQTALNKAGYALDVDGIYGAKTQAAVRDYQSKNGLMVDGIAGSQTQGALYGTTQSAAKTEQKTEQKTAADYAYDASGDADYQAALKALEAAKAETAPSYDDSYDQQLSTLYDQIMHREPFSYDLSGDTVYQQYRQQYARQGRTAMMDTMGQAAALTGGYASTYAQTAGQQQYDAYLRQLSEIVPDLYQMALSGYNAEGESLADRYAMLSGLRDNAYGQYQDELDAYNQNIQNLQNRADTLYDRGYQNWKTGVELQKDAEETAYEKQQDAYDRAVEIITTLGYIPTDLLAEAGMSSTEAQKWLNYYYAQHVVTTTSSSSASGSSKKSSSSSKKSSSSSKSSSSTKKSSSSNGYSTLTGLLSGNLSATKKRNLIVAYYQSGKITKTQYNSLLSRYAVTSSASALKSAAKGTSATRAVK